VAASSNLVRTLGNPYREGYYSSEGDPIRRQTRALEIRTSVGYLARMPIYEFHCEKCERDSEILLRSKDAVGIECPYCGSKRLVKKFSVFASNAVGKPAPGGNKGGGGCGGCCGGGPHRH
jgi:putative FmdB family regulatory protein